VISALCARKSHDQYATPFVQQINPKYAADHQLTVIDCLEDPDETLKRKTLDLLYSMTNPANVTVIVDKLMAYLKTATDKFLRADLVGRITQVSSATPCDVKPFSCCA
jgi:AP-4 complex subunit epsilon-1